MATVTQPKLITADEYLVMPGLPERTELVRGVVVPMNPPGFTHGKICSRINRIIGAFVEEHDLGHTLSNDSGIVTEREPDTVRGADVEFYSYSRLPKGKDPEGYPTVVPEIVFEVVSPSDTRKVLTRKAAEYLKAGVNVVCVVDPKFKSVNVIYPELPVAKLQGDDALTFDELPGFSMSVSKFFE